MLFLRVFAEGIFLLEGYGHNKVGSRRKRQDMV